MAEAPGKIPVTEEKTPEGSTGAQASGPFNSLRQLPCNQSLIGR